ncbi:MAG: TetR family transcriptional regulator C-terminal domain-containing protein [Sphingopyxis sp.]|nr:TetR family transcriptional regulator C-terminal domain-containing protein [Sphingopyxis sp.]
MQAARQPFTRESADVRREALIDATCAALAEAGLEGVSVRSICARAGVSPGLLRHYFAGIDDLVCAAYAATAERMDAIFEEAIVTAPALPRAQLTAFLTASFRPPVTDPALLGSWTAFWALARTNARAAEIHRTGYAAYRARLAGLLEKCGMAPAAASQLAIALTALVDGLWLELVLDPASFGSDGAIALIETTLAAYFARDTDLGL